MGTLAARARGLLLRYGVATPARWAVFALALAVRLYFNLVAHRPEDFVFSDMRVYETRAAHLLDGTRTAWDTFTPVGYPAFLALVHMLTRHDATAVAVLQAFMGAATCAVAFRLAERITGSTRAALVAAAGLSVYVPLVFYGGLVLSEGPASFFVALAALALVEAARADRPHRWLAAAGLSIGALTIIRPNAVLCFPVVCLYLWVKSGRDVRRAWRLVAAVVAWATPLIVGACIRNSLLLGHPAGLATNGGLNFLLAHTEYSGAAYVEGANTHRIVPIPNLVHYASRGEFVSPVPFYEEAYFYRRGLEHVATHPWEIVRSLANVRDGIGLGRLTFWPGWDPPGGSRVPAQVLAFFSRAFFSLAFVPSAGLALVLAVRRRLFAREEADRLLLVGLAASSLVTLYLFLGDPRVRVPFDTCFWLLAVDAFARARKILTARRDEDG